MRLCRAVFEASLHDGDTDVAAVLARAYDWQTQHKEETEKLRQMRQELSDEMEKVFLCM